MRTINHRSMHKPSLSTFGLRLSYITSVLPSFSQPALLDVYLVLMYSTINGSLFENTSMSNKSVHENESSTLVPGPVWS